MARTGKQYTFEDGMIVAGLSALARVFMFGQWAKIGVDHYLTALDKDPGEAFDDLLVATVSAAFAIDSYTKDLPHSRVPKDAKKTCVLGLGSGEGHHAYEVLNNNYDLNDEQRDRWHRELHGLFELRSDAVHYRGEPMPTFKHENGIRYHPLVGMYTPDVARAALVLAREIMMFCVVHPSSRNDELTDVIERLLGGQVGGFEQLP